MPKKDFKSNPALQFISSAREPEVYTPADKPEPGRATQPRAISAQHGETKSRRVQLLVQPSLWRDLEEIAARSGISNNEAVIKAIRAYIEREG